MDNLRRFLVVFCAMLVVAAAVCGIRLVRSYNESNKGLVTDLEVAAPTFDPSGNVAAETFQNNILFIVNDRSLDHSQLMFVVNVDTASRTLNFLFLPAELKYNVSASGTVGDYATMYYGYSSGGAQACASVVSSFFDIDVNYYFCIETDDAARLLNSFCSEDNGVLFDIPIDLYYRDYEHNININFKKGVRYLAGEDAVSFLTFYRTQDSKYSTEMLTYYDGTDAKRLEMVMRFFDAFITQKFFEPSTDFYLRHFAELVMPYVRSGETNLTEAVLVKIAEILSVTNAQRIGYYMPVGEYSYNDKLYLEYNGYVRNMLLDSSTAPSYASEVFQTRFKTSY